MRRWGYMTALPGWLIVRATIEILFVAAVFLIVSRYAFGRVMGLEGPDRFLASVIWMACVVAMGGLAFRLGGGFGLALVALILFLGRTMGQTSVNPGRWVRVLDWWDTLQRQHLRSQVATYLTGRFQAFRRQAQAVRPERWLVSTAAVLVLALIVVPPSRAWSVSGSLTGFVSSLAKLEAALSGTPFTPGVRPVGLDVLLMQWDSLSHLNPLLLTLIWPPVCRIVTVCCVMYVGARLGASPAAGLCAGFLYTVAGTIGVWHVGQGSSSAVVAPLLAVLTFHCARLAFTADDGRAAAWTVFALLALSGLIGWLPFADTLLTLIAVILGYALGGGALRPPVIDVMVGIPLAVLPGTLAIAWGLWSGRTVIPFWYSPAALPPVLLALLAIPVVVLWARQILLTLGRGPAISSDAFAVTMLCGALALVSVLVPSAADPALALLAVSLAVAVLWRAQEHLRWTRHLAQGAAAMCIAGSLLILWLGVTHSSPYAAQSANATVAAYARIETSLPAGTWVAVDTSPYELAAARGTIYSPTLWVEHATMSGGASDLSYGGSPIHAQHVLLFLRYLGSPTQESYADDELWIWYRSWLSGGGKSVQYFHAGDLTVFELLTQHSATSAPVA